MKGMEISKANCEDLIQYCELEGEEAVLFLQGKGASINNCDEHGIVPIHIVSAVGAENILNLLLLRGADVDKNTSIGWTSVMYAARNGHSKCVQQLIECGSDIYHRNKLGVGVLSMAAASGNKEIIEILLHAMQNNMLPDDVISALQVAALRGQSTALQLLLSSHSHLINACDKYGITPLMLAVAGGHVEAIKILLDFGADAGLQNSHQFTALDIAFAKGLRNVIYLLKDKTEKRDDQSCKKCQSLDVGSDLVEQYGWSSICTPKLQRATWYHNLHKENLLISPAHQILSANSKVSFQAVEDNTDIISSLFIPVNLPICNQCPVVPVATSVKNNVLIDTDSTHVPVPPMSPYSCSLPFNFSKTIPEKKYHSVSSLNCSCPNEVQSELNYSLINELCCKNDPLESVAHSPPVKENCNRRQSQAKKGSKGKFWKTGKVEKWLHTVLTSLQKNTKVKNNSPHNQKNTLGPSGSSQCCVNINAENMLFGFQKNSDSYTNNKNAVSSSTSSILKNLLVNLELQTYIPLFVEHEVDMDSFLMLRQEDLEEIGITSPKSQNKLLKVIMTFKGES